MRGEARWGDVVCLTACMKGNRCNALKTDIFNVFYEGFVSDGYDGRCRLSGVLAEIFVLAEVSKGWRGLSVWNYLS